MAHLVGFLELVEDVTLAHLVGVQLEAERSQADPA